MNKYYVIKSRDSVFEDYALFVVDTVRSELTGDYDWQVSHTNSPSDATKFIYINDAFTMMGDVGMEEHDWEVVLYEETK